MKTYMTPLLLCAALLASPAAGAEPVQLTDQQLDLVTAGELQTGRGVTTASTSSQAFGGGPSQGDQAAFSSGAGRLEATTHTEFFVGEGSVTADAARP